MTPQGTLPWIWVGFAIILTPCAILCLLLAWETVKPRPRKRLLLGDTAVELWISERKLPGGAGAVIVPVAPDLKMVGVGIAKWARDATADQVQHEADSVAPLQPGEAFVGSGGKYRFQIAALAVVMDEQKRTEPAWITRAITTAITMARGRDAITCLLPDMTDDLLRQPDWITEEQRRETCRPIARAMMEAVVASRDVMDEIKIWVWRADMADVWIPEFERVEAAQARGQMTAGAAH